ncbi:hypothetical protein B0H14DRAFT_3060952 [Mycena olivaceomarginata]|nr:hypothetical protein B0H14DRAFT_3060952 [Mycena olivaceomarginata]
MCFPLSPSVTLLTFPPLLVSKSVCSSLLAISALLTFSSLLVSSGCVHFLYHLSLPHSLSFAFLSLDYRVSSSSVTLPCLTHFPPPSCL